MTGKIHEYGGTFGISMNYLPDSQKETMLAQQVREITEILDICGDATVVKDFEIVDSPKVDGLERFKIIGWYGCFSSLNYEKMQAHFRCKKQHIPEIITMEFINQLIMKYAAQTHQKDEDY